LVKDAQMLALPAATLRLNSTVSMAADGERLNGRVSVASVLAARMDSNCFRIGLGAYAVESFDDQSAKTALSFR